MSAAAPDWEGRARFLAWLVQTVKPTPTPKMLRAMTPEDLRHYQWALTEDLNLWVGP